MAKGKATSDKETTLEDLQALGREMQEGVGFDPPVQFKETDYDDLLYDVKHNAKDLDPVKDANAISERGRRTLVKIKAGPWWEDGGEQQPEPSEEEQRTSQRGATKTKPAKPPEKTEDEDVKKKGKVKGKVATPKAKAAKSKEKSKAKPPAKKTAGKTAKNQGIGEWVKGRLRKDKTVSNVQLAEEARQKFPGAKTSPACVSYYRARL